MKRLVFFAAAIALGAPALAGPTDDLLGTWECRVEGAAPTKTPPIVWFGLGNAAANVDLDGFSRTVYGISDVAADANGWWKVQPQDGQSFLVKPITPVGKAATPAMTLKRGDTSYNCLRLPNYS
jgi:hypothetical protein